MASLEKTVFYPPLEEKINIASHGFGIMLSVIAFILLIIKSTEDNNTFHIIAYLIYGLSLIVLYSASTIYHSSKDAVTRNKLNVFDHSSIFILIAGTYTPYTLITLEGKTGWIVFGVVWALAFIGIILKLFLTGRFKILSTVMYVLMGWLMIFAIKPMILNLSQEGLWWLLIGGISYTLGAVLYSIKRIKYNHAIFHIFVLLGSISHFISIYFYV